MQINENRRLWEVDHKVEQMDNYLKISMNDIIDMFKLPTEDGEYLIEDSMLLLYNPITSIVVKDGEVTVNTFYDDPYTREGFICPFKGIESKIGAVQTKDNNLDMAKTFKYEEISASYQQEFITGFYHSDVLGIDVDYRRNGTYNDLQNVEVLINVMTSTGQTETVYSGYEDQKAPATFQQIKDLKKEMELYSVILYNKKKGLEKNIDDATTIAQVKAVTW